MTPLPGKHASFWIDSTPETDFAPLAGSVSVDVAVVGGGITGITAATLLKRAGKTVALVEADRVARGVTGHTTAKVTSSHSVIYSELVRSFGEDGARAYAESQQAGLERIARFVEDEGIDCDFERTSNYLYSESHRDLGTIEQEVEAAASAGLPATFVRESPLPFPIAGAVRFDDQVQLHPRKYLLHLVAQLPGDGSAVFEQTRAVDVEEGDRCVVRTAAGRVVAQDVVVATGLPFLDRGLFFAKAHPYRSYVVCPRVEETKAPAGMFVSMESPTHTVRRSPYPGGALLVIAGEGHKVGHESATDERYRSLDEWARSRFEIESIEYRWSTQDYYSVDKVPYIGRVTRRSRRVYVATGYSAWGLTNGTAAAMILSDAILGVANPWADLYDPHRVKPKASAAMFVKENVDAAKHWFLRRRVTTRKAGSPADLGPGEGAIVTLDGKNVALYRDEAGRLSALAPTCTHLGCVVGWNSAERTWDCPCHGSRFDTEGKVVQGPAVRDLKRMDDVLARADGD